MKKPLLEGLSGLLLSFTPSIGARYPRFDTARAEMHTLN
jgi:hypothetical protein